MTPHPPMYDERQWTDRTCGYEAPIGNRCPNLATMHVLWTVDGDNSIDCDQHWNETKQRWTYVLAHPLEAVCCAPGSTWVFAENRCLIEGLDESVPALAEALPNLRAEVEP